MSKAEQPFDPASARRKASRAMHDNGEGLPVPLGITLDDKYLVDSVLGQGSMGLVYLGHDIGLERQVAIKVLAPKYAADQTVAKRFRREAIAMANVRAENVVQIFAFGDYRSYPYFVMEYVPGYTVGSLIESANRRGEQLYLDVVLGILRQVCKGLQAVHDRGIVHRDVKPPNMLVGPSFRVAITDFGLVELIDRAESKRDLAGTPLYLAPELISRQAVDDDLRHTSDIYALAVSAYEMLTGDVPFDGANIEQIFDRHLRDTPRPVSEHRSDFPPQMDEVIARALSKEPAQRQASCSEFMEGLDSTRKAQTLSGTPRTGTLRILLAEDDEDLRNIYVAALKVGLPEAIVLSAADGLTALELARSSRVDLMLVDINMPQMNGLELCATLRGDDLTANIPLVVISATRDAELPALLERLGINQVLRKPVELTHLVDVARRHLEETP